MLSFHLKSVDAKGKDSFLPFSSVPWIYMTILISEPYCLYYYSFVVILEIRSFSVFTWVTRPFPNWSPASTFACCSTSSIQHPERSYSDPDLTSHLCVYSLSFASALIQSLNVALAMLLLPIPSSLLLAPAHSHFFIPA